MMKILTRKKIITNAATRKKAIQAIIIKISFYKCIIKKLVEILGGFFLKCVMGL